MRQGAPAIGAVDSAAGLRVAVIASSWHAEVMAGLQAGARRALADLSAVAPYDPGKPCEILVDFNTSDHVERYRYREGVDIVDSRQIAVRADDWWTAWRRFFF